MRLWKTLLTPLSPSSERGLIVSILVIILMIVFFILRLQQLQIANELRREAALVAARSEVQTIQAFSNYYSGVIVPRAGAAGMKMTHDYTSYPSALPFPMSMVKDIGASLGDGERQQSFRFYSDWPWKFREDGGPKNDFERRALRAFESGSHEEFSEFINDEDGLTISYASPIVMKESCIDCHNTSQSSPKQDWKSGDIRGAVSVGVTLPPGPSIFSFNGLHWSVVGFFLLIAMLVLPCLALLFSIVRARDAVDRDKLSNELDHAIILSKAKTQFLASVSHELRTPLNAIIGFSEMIKRFDGNLSPHQRVDYAGDIHSSGLHLLSLVNDILDLEKIENGKMEMEEVDVRLIDVLSERVSLIQGVAANRAVTVRLTRNRYNPIVSVDVRMIRQILDNLISNAVKFSHEGGRVTVSLEENEVGEILILVQDRGIGIAADVIPSLFQPFQQADATVSRDYGGTGLGLAIVEKQLRLHGAAVEIQSVLGRGTTVIVTLPKNRVVVNNKSSYVA